MKPISRLRRKAKLGDQGFPKATLAFYGPDNNKATKAVLGIFLNEEDEVQIQRFFNEVKDVRYCLPTQEDILARLKEHNVKSLIMTEGIFGCPHEEGIDYPDGEKCPKCPYWKDHDRFESL